MGSLKKQKNLDNLYESKVYLDKSVKDTLSNVIWKTKEILKCNPFKKYQNISFNLSLPPTQKKIDKL